MTSLAYPLVSWAEFRLLPERPENVQRYELHDGEVVIVPLPRPRDLKIQTRIEHLLQRLAGERGIVRIEFPYRPAVNLQFWVADVAYVPIDDWRKLARDEYFVYAPPLVVEVLSPS